MEQQFSCDQCKEAFLMSINRKISFGYLTWNLVSVFFHGMILSGQRISEELQRICPLSSVSTKMSRGRREEKGCNISHFSHQKTSPFVPEGEYVYNFSFQFKSPRVLSMRPFVLCEVEEKKVEPCSSRFRLSP